MTNIKYFNQWLDSSEVDRIENFVSTLKKDPFVPEYGRFPNQLIANQHWHEWNDHDDLGQILKTKIEQIIGPHLVVETDFVELFLPWDIHSECDRPTKGSGSYYTIIIPFDAYPSRTVIFDQTAMDSNHFYIYKKNNQILDNPVDIEFWNENLSHCWPEDREYLSVRYVSEPWCKGDALFFPRTHFHASDNFHLRMQGPKRFLQILTDLK
jgi:hypothetical protein